MKDMETLVTEMTKQIKLYSDVAKECRAEGHETAYWFMRGKMEGLLEALKMLDVETEAEAESDKQEETVLASNTCSPSVPGSRG